MNILFIILGSIAAIIILLLVIALFTKKSYALERQVTINAAKDKVFEYIRFSKNQLDYNKWWMMDPSKKMTYTGTDGTVGFVARWDSNDKKVGAGEQEIKNITDGERVDYEIRFIRPFAGIAPGHITVTPTNDGQTIVKWGFSSTMKYPFNIMLLLMNVEGMLTKDLDLTLQNLKTILEK